MQVENWPGAQAAPCPASRWTRLLRSAVTSAALCAIFVPGLARSADPAATAHHRVYSHLMDPREHPDDSRRAVRPPDWSTFDGVPQFAATRSFEVKDGRIVNFKAELDKYTVAHDLGRAVWPSYPILFASNLGDLADEINRRGLYLFDIWGYVPGSGPGGYWQQFQPPAGVFPLLESKLGGRWLGMDNGEQDGRYIGTYAEEMQPSSGTHFDQYLNFRRHFSRLTTELGGKMATLVSLNFGHYFLKEGNYTLIGAETGQALPNSQVYYAFIRGAGKQYGVPWFGNASVWNRWGYKTYGEEGSDHGPRKGTSLSLMKRLLYSQLLYNSMLLGYESSWFQGDQLSPVGRLQESAQHWVKENGQPGAMVTPIAIMTDFYSGWSFPRHLYSGNVYRVWGNRPYERGDYMTDLVLDMLYPGYQDSSYFHDETGFLTPTPYGDAADCLLSDAPGWLLARYPVVVVSGDLTPGAEIEEKLRAYAAGGGRLFISARNAEKLGGLKAASMTVIPDPEPVPVTRVSNEVDQPLPKPYRLSEQARTVLDEAFRAQVLFEAGEGLSLITARRAPGEYTLSVTNNSWQARPFRIVSHCGPVESIRELTLDTAERSAAGFVPEGLEGRPLGANGEHTIAGGDVRIFRVRVREQGVEEIAHVAPPARPQGRILPLRRIHSIEDAVLARPTFFQNYDGVLVDWRNLRERETSALEQEGRWIRQQRLRVIVDLSSGLNLYPDLRLVDNVQSDYAASMKAIDDVLAKMALLGSSDLVMSLHRVPENNITPEETWSGFEKTVRDISRKAKERGITVHLRLNPAKPPRTIAEAAAFVRRVGADNLRIAPSTALLIAAKVEPALAVRDLDGMLGLWLAAAPRVDVAGKLWDAHGSIAGQARVLDYPKAAPAPVVFDAVYANQDEEYLDAREFRAHP
jgi:hypothetical protein